MGRGRHCGAELHDAAAAHPVRMEEALPNPEECYEECNLTTKCTEPPITAAVSSLGCRPARRFRRQQAPRCLSKATALEASHCFRPVHETGDWAAGMWVVDLHSTPRSCLPEADRVSPSHQSHPQHLLGNTQKHCYSRVAGCSATGLWRRTSSSSHSKPTTRILDRTRSRRRAQSSG